MVRHVFRIVVKQGHWKDFLAAVKLFNEAAPRAGLPVYRLYTPGFGTVNEAFAEAEFESSADIEARWATANGDADFVALVSAVSIHYADGETHDYWLAEENVG